MKIIAVDDEQLALDSIVELLNEILPDAEIKGFLKAQDCFTYLQSNPADIAFLDIEMGSMNGIMLAKKCKDLWPEINIIFVTGYDQYALEAMRMHASGYLIKPLRVKDLKTELNNLRHPVEKRTRRVRVQTFGNFAVFVDHKPLSIPLSKCRECLAYLIDRKGAFITTAELSAILWEDKPYDKVVQNNTHKVISDLMKLLRKEGISDIIIKTSREIGIDLDKVDCDYYGFLRGDLSQINAFRGEYMTNYSWAEFTLAGLVKTKNYIK